jgi:hypothetical protein
LQLLLEQKFLWAPSLVELRYHSCAHAEPGTTHVLHTCLLVAFVVGWPKKDPKKAWENHNRRSSWFIDVAYSFCGISRVHTGCHWAKCVAWCPWDWSGLPISSRRGLGMRH